MSNIILNSLINKEENRWIKQDLLPLLSILNIDEESFQGNRFFFIFPLSKENIIENLHRISKKNYNMIENDLIIFDELFKEYFDFKIISNDQRYKHRTPSGYTHWHHITYCNSTKNSEIYYILGNELVGESNKALNNLKLNSSDILKSIIKKIHNIEDLIYLALVKFAVRKNQDRKSFEFKSDYIEKDDDIYFLFQNSDLEEEIINYYLYNKIIDYESNAHSFKLDFNKFLRILGKSEKYYTILYSHSFVSTSCIKENNILIEQNIAKEIFSKLDVFPFEKWLKKSYSNIKSEIEKDVNNLPLFIYKSQFKLLKWIKESSQPCIFDIENEKELLEALEYFKKSRILEVIDDGILKSNEQKFDEKFDELKSEEINRIEKNKRKLLTRWLRWENDDLNTSLLKLYELEQKPTFELEKLKELKIEREKKGIIVFISYATKDSDYFQIPLIKEKLENYPEINSVLIWKEDSGMFIGEFMNKYIKICSVFIAICSENSEKSKPVNLERNIALQHYLDRNLKIIPVFEKKSKIPDIFIPFLGVQFDKNNFDNFIKELHFEIHRKKEIFI